MSTTTDELLDEVLAYLDGPRNGPYEHDLACRRLRALPIEDRAHVIHRLIEKNVQFALRIGHNALGSKFFQNEFLIPALMTCDPADIKHYVFYGVTQLTASKLLVQMCQLRRQNPKRVGEVFYYLTARLSGGATQALEAARIVLPELAAAGALDFDPETWEGGPNDYQWFSRVDSANPICWPPICDYLRLHGTLPKEETERMLGDLHDLRSEILTKRKLGEVTVIAEERRQAKDQSIRALLDEVCVYHGLTPIGDGWQKIVPFKSKRIATAFLQRDLAYKIDQMTEVEAYRLVHAFMWRFTSKARWFTNEAADLPSWSPLTNHTFDRAIACVDIGIVAILLVADED